MKQTTAKNIVRGGLGLCLVGLTANGIIENNAESERKSRQRSVAEDVRASLGDEALVDVDETGRDDQGRYVGQVALYTADTTYICRVVYGENELDDTRHQPQSIVVTCPD